MPIALFQLHVIYHGDSLFNEMMFMSTLYQINMVSLVFIVLAYWNDSAHECILLHSDKLSKFWANQPLLFKP
jgi:hypothetical protein